MLIDEIHFVAVLVNEIRVEKFPRVYERRNVDILLFRTLRLFFFKQEFFIFGKNIDGRIGRRGRSIRLCGDFGIIFRFLFIGERAALPALFYGGGIGFARRLNFLFVVLSRGGRRRMQRHFRRSER